MRLLCLYKHIILLLVLPAILAAEKTAIYYGKDFPREKLSFFDNIIVQPDNVPIELISKNPEKFYAYISVCESDEELPEDLKIGENKDWKTYIWDMRKVQYRELLEEKARKIYQRGFRNFFLDTLDSYIPLIENQEEKDKYAAGIIEFIKKLKENFPDSKIIINRGFEIMRDIKKYSDSMVAESLYKAYDPVKSIYYDKKTEDSLWLKGKLKEAQELGYSITVVDYLPPTEKSKRLELARKIKKDGFSPYISDGNLEFWGQTEYEKIKRKILVFYDSSISYDKVYSQAHRIVSGPIEYLGYIPVLLDIKNGLPEKTDDFSGVIFVLGNYKTKNPDELINWINQKIKEGLKFVFLGYIPLPLERYYLNQLGINVEKNLSVMSKKNKTITNKKYIGEIAPYFYYTENFLSISSGVVVSQSINDKGQKHSQAAITQWGGYAIDGSWLEMIKDYEVLPINLYTFLKDTLRLPDIPIPDPTTENGRRIMFAHIDGDGFSSLCEYNNSLYSGEVLIKEILTKYKIPHSVSVIRGEIEHPSLTKEIQERLKKIAKEIFKLENVEVGNHSYSHPFKWVDITRNFEYHNVKQIYGLNIPGYTFNLEYEIIGTKKWLEEELAPQGKKNKIFFWTGDCIAPSSALKILNDNKMLNINGGNTFATKEAPYISLISPYGIERDGYYQIYAGQQNENVYTGLRTGPFWGYKKVIETFVLTENPRRLKPLNIYYHFYSATKYPSLKALKDVYDYAMKQKTNPQYASQYVKKVKDFYECEIYNYENEWVISSSGDLKTFRVASNRYPEIYASAAGFEKNKNENYIHLFGKPPFYLILTNKKPSVPYLKNSNASIIDFKSENKKIYIKLQGNVKIEYEIGNNNGCEIIEKNNNKNNFFEKEIYGKCK
ncbi:MAG: endo alpha-1,4 polygalactosaminidase [Elusimicrobiota bacterium]